MPTVRKTVSDILQDNFKILTRAERKLANALLENYPIIGLKSITRLAESAGVSTPTVVRMAQKLGFRGFPELQNALRDELEATISNPIAKHDQWSEHAPDTHILNRFADAVIDNMRQTLNQLSPNEFDAACALLADRKRSVHIVGGRITHALADYLFTHLQVIRESVTHLPPNSNIWPHYVLNMKPGDVLVIFDIRRYEQDLINLAEIAKASDVTIILFTDQWGSPVAKSASRRFNIRIEAPSAWDSSVVTLFLLEATIAAVETKIWGVTKGRMKHLETLFDKTKLFR